MNRQECPVCHASTPVTKAGLLRVHKRQELLGRWRMVPCAGSGWQVKS